MKTDRELLEMAAKAAGPEIFFDGGGWLARIPEGNGSRWNLIAEWNPLSDEGDALRLAVKLSLIIHCPHKNSVFVGVGEYPNQILERLNNDPYAATRRAIVRAAAAIGEAMP